MDAVRTPPSDLESDARFGVVLQTAGRPLDAALRRRMEERGWDLVAVTDPCLAMAELCLQERAQASRSAWGLETPRPSALVITSLDTDPVHAFRDDLVAALRAFVPGAAAFVVESDRLVEIVEASRPPSTRGEDPPRIDDAEEDRVRRTAPAMLRLAGDATAPRAAADDEEPTAEDEDPIDDTRLTPEEIAMLFRGDPGEHPPP